METPQRLAGEPSPLLDEPQDTLLRVARLLYSAAAAAEQVTVSRALDLSLDDRLAEFDVKILLWQTVALLPPGLRLDRGEPETSDAGRSDDLRSTLQAALQVLRSASLTELPVGASSLLADLTALIARLDASGREASDGRLFS